MRLAIADPPYLGRADTWYGNNHNLGTGCYPADKHPKAHIWDNPQTHIDLARNLNDNYDGFAIACTPHSLSTYLSVLETGSSTGIRVMAWIKPNAMPGGNRLTLSWESVIIKMIADRKGRNKGKHMRDYHIAPAPRKNFTGSKPESWTHWLLDAIGYQKGDEVIDLFKGSGSVDTAINTYVM